MTAPRAYHIALTDAERTFMEQTAFNFFTATGTRMLIPPRLFSDLKAGGVDMQHMDIGMHLDDETRGSGQ